VNDLEYDDIPADVIEDSKYHILDGVGVTFPASLEGNSQALLQVVKDEMSGRSESTVLVFGEKSSMAGAALINGMMIGTTLDFDDLHVRAGLHPTTIVFPAVLASAEYTRASGKELLVAFVAAAEVAIRLGLTAPGRYHKRNFQPTSIIGTLASGLGAGKVFGLSEEELVNVIGLATNMTSASPLSVAVGSYFQGIDTGRACESGILAAILAQKGFTSIKEESLENQFGFLNTFAGPENYTTEPLSLGLGKTWNIPETFLKRYPTTYAFTRYLDASLELQSKHRLKPEDIREVTYGVNSDHGPMFTTPYDIKVKPPNRNEARTSQFFAMAAAFVDGKVTLDTFNADRISDRRILELAKKIRPVNDESDFWVQVETNGGEVFRATKTQLRQSSKEEIVSKFYDNAGRVVDSSRAEQALTATLSLENNREISEWPKLLVKAG
jgi:2-methylcitrate dehydratase PrpD